MRFGQKLRTAFRNSEKSTERGRQEFLGFSPCQGRRGDGKFAEGIGDAGENFFLIRDMILYGRNQTGYQIRTAPELLIKVRQILVHDFIHGNQTDVLREEQIAAEKSERDHGEDYVCWAPL